MKEKVFTLPYIFRIRENLSKFILETESQLQFDTAISGISAATAAAAKSAESAAERSGLPES